MGYPLPEALLPGGFPSLSSSSLSSSCGSPFRGFQSRLGKYLLQCPCPTLHHYLVLAPLLMTPKRWLIAHGNLDKAREIIAALEAKPLSDPYVVTQIQEIEFSVQYERENSVRWKDVLFRYKSEPGGTKSLRRLILGAGTQFIQQFEGINIMSYYLPTGKSVTAHHLSCLWALSHPRNNSPHRICWPFKHDGSLAYGNQLNHISDLLFWGRAASRAHRPAGFDASLDSGARPCLPYHHGPTAVFIQRREWRENSYGIHRLLLSVLYCIRPRDAWGALAIPDRD